MIPALTRAIPERLTDDSDEQLIMKRYTNKIYFTLLLNQLHINDSLYFPLLAIVLSCIQKLTANLHTSYQWHRRNLR